MTRARVQFAIIVYAALAAVATIGCAISGRSAWHLEHTLGGARRLSLPLALALGALVGMTAVRATRWTTEHTRWGRSLAHELSSAVTGLDRRAVLWLALASATGEELLFRGAIQSGLVDHGGLAQGIALTSVLFGALHVPANRKLVSWTFMATAMGAVFGLLYVWTGEILAPLVAHAVVNFANLRWLLDLSPKVSDRAPRSAR